MSTPSRPPPDPLLRVEVDAFPHQVDVRLIGEMDLSTRGQLLQALDEKHLNGATRVQLDLSRLDFLDACGISELVAVQDRMGRQQRSFSALHVQPHVLRLLQLTGLGDLLGDPAAAGEPDAGAATAPI